MYLEFALFNEMPPKKSLDLNRLRRSVENCEDSKKQFTISKFFAKSVATTKINKDVTIVIDDTEDEGTTVSKEKKVHILYFLGR